MKTPKPKWSLPKFYRDYYVPAALANKRRKPPSERTLYKRSNAVRHFRELMATKKRPKGPRLSELSEDHLIEFRERLEDAEYQRGPKSEKRKLSPHSQKSIMEEVLIVVSATGPRVSGTSIRAGVLEFPPTIYVPSPPAFPKGTWTLDEARAVAAGLLTFVPPKQTPLPTPEYRKLAIAWLCLLIYLGHRATTYKRVGSSSLKQIRPGEWVIDIAKSVKTGKPDRVPVHPRLLVALQALGEGEPLINWPYNYRTLVDHFRAWQLHAGLAEDRIHTPQAMRRLHAQEMQRTGFAQVEKMASSSLGHSSVGMTANHYSDARGIAIMGLPDIFEATS